MSSVAFVESTINPETNLDEIKLQSMIGKILKEKYGELGPKGPPGDKGPQGEQGS